jgi:hypothetical protein
LSQGPFQYALVMRSYDLQIDRAAYIMKVCRHDWRGRGVYWLHSQWLLFRKNCSRTKKVLIRNSNLNVTEM